MSDKDEIGFCSSCFATTENGSWNHVVIGHYCTNCGAGGGIVKMPKFAADEIRRCASWVGKRYYPADEDREISAELKKLRNLMQSYPGRTAELHKGEGFIKEVYIVTQKLPKGRSVSVFIEATTPEQAIEKTRTSLPYVCKEEL